MFNFAEELPPVRTGRVLWIGSVAVLVVLAAVAGYVYLNRVPPVAEGKLPLVRAYQPHAVVPGSAAKDDVAADAQDSAPLVVLAPVSIRNVGKKPLIVSDLIGTLMLGDTEYRSFDVSAEDFPKVFQLYPELAQPKGQQPVLRHATMQPGETVTGMLVFNYPLTLEQWSQRKSFAVTVTFEHEKDLVLADPSLSPPAEGEHE